MAPTPLVAVVCGSRSDLPTLRGCFDVLDSYAIPWEASVISAHRQPEALASVRGGRPNEQGASLHRGRGSRGTSARRRGQPHRAPGDRRAARRRRPGGADALYSVVQMPPGVPVAGVAIGSAGARNAAHLAARILALGDGAVAERVEAFRAEQAGRAEVRIDPRADNGKRDGEELTLDR